MILTKKCWSCEATTPYEIGWCGNCWNEFPSDIQKVLMLVAAGIGTEPFAGQIRGVCADLLKVSRYKAKPKLRLEDLKI